MIIKEILAGVLPGLLAIWAVVKGYQFKNQKKQFLKDHGINIR